MIETKMKMSLEVPFRCPENMKPFLRHVFEGEYDIPFYLNSARILDLGANFGAFSLWAIHRFPYSQVWAYEPNPDAYFGCLKNLETYLDRIKVLNHGIGSPGIRLLRNGKHNEGESSFYPMNGCTKDEGYSVKVEDPLTLPEADIIKLDIEGCEMEVLRPLIGAGRTFSFILLEWHSDSLRREVDQLLSDYSLVGSEVQSVTGRGISKYAHRSLIP